MLVKNTLHTKGLLHVGTTGNMVKMSSERTYSLHVSTAFFNIIILFITFYVVTAFRGIVKTYNKQTLLVVQGKFPRSQNENYTRTAKRPEVIIQIIRTDEVAFFLV